MGFLSWLVGLVSRRRPIPEPAPPPSMSSISPSAVVAEINRVRTRNGRGLLWEDRLVGNVAQEWAMAIAANEALDHGNFFGRIASVYPNHPAGEDIAAGQISAKQVVGDWMADPPHRETLLGNYNHVGVGVARSSQGILYWVADFVLV